MKVVLVSLICVVGLLIVVFHSSNPTSKGAITLSNKEDDFNASSTEQRRQPGKSPGSDNVVEKMELSSALETIKGSLGPGQKRELAIQLAFANSKDSMISCLEVYRNLQDPGERRSANLGMAFRLAREGDLSLIYDFLEQKPKLTVKEASIFANGLGLMIDPLSVNRFRGMEGYLSREEVVEVPLVQIVETLNQLILYEPDGQSRDNRLRGLLEHAHRDRPFEVFELFQSDLKSSSDDYGDVLKNAIVFMFGENPSLALSVLEADDYSTISATEFEFGLKSWMAMDQTEASTWLGNEGRQLPAKLRDAGQGALARNSVEIGDLETAKALAGEITDSKLKKQIDDVIWLGELQLVRSKVVSDPSKTLNGFVEGTSVHEEYWIKEGFKMWFSSSPDDANEWYSSNQGTMPPSQSQHVARAYAEVALSDGNSELARQWAERVVDPDFKRKLVNQIEAASQKNSE